MGMPNTKRKENAYAVKRLLRAQTATETVNENADNNVVLMSPHQVKIKRLSHNLKEKKAHLVSIKQRLDLTIKCGLANDTIH